MFALVCVSICIRLYVHLRVLTCTYSFVHCCALDSSVPSTFVTRECLLCVLVRTFMLPRIYVHLSILLLHSSAFDVTTSDHANISIVGRG
ncbi:hypothetical protein BDR03DRAFT_945159 [Suillus americanus]|nr:hypothetical protein BDR03DRAFT_945159 [Suillus americanus]